MPTDAARKFELLFRLYGPQKSLFEKTWKLPDVEVLCELSSTRAAKLLATEEIDLVVADVCMPELSGVELPPRLFGFRKFTVPPTRITVFVNVLAPRRDKVPLPYLPTPVGAMGEERIDPFTRKSPAPRRCRECSALRSKACRDSCSPAR